MFTEQTNAILTFPDIAVAAQPLLNSLLSDDVLDDGYVS
jgi:hypothetical protein